MKGASLPCKTHVFKRTCLFTTPAQLNETHLVAVRGLIHQGVSTKMRLSGRLN